MEKFVRDHLYYVHVTESLVDDVIRWLDEDDALSFVGRQRICISLMDDNDKDVHLISIIYVKADSWESFDAFVDAHEDNLMFI